MKSENPELLGELEAKNKGRCLRTQRKEVDKRGVYWARFLTD